MPEKKNEMWAVLEIMGHNRFAGYLSEETIAGHGFVRIDVPECVVGQETYPGFTKLFGPGSVYGITPCTEETARAFAVSMRSRAFADYEAPRLTAIDPSDVVVLCHDDSDEPY